MNPLFGFALLVTLVPASLGAQTLAEAAKAEAARRATAAKATKVFRTKDLPASRARPASVPVTPPDDTATAVEAPLSGREAAQLRDLEIVKAQQALQDSRQQLRTAEISERALQQRYDNTCLGRRPIELIRPCGDMRSALHYDLPQLRSEIQANIRNLEQFLAQQ